MTGGSISTSAKGGNALVATNNGVVTINKTIIDSTGSGSARGLHATYGGSITANSVTVSSSGGSCATLATDRGEGTVKCIGCTLTTSGAGSPLIYSTGDITVESTTGTSNAAQAVVVEGKNSATIKSSSRLSCTASPNNGRNDSCGVLIYQSQSGDAASGTSSFSCDSSTLEILSSSSYYTSAPVFYITNTDANINLTGCTFNYGSNKFINIGAGNWGTNGSNGGNVTMTLSNQNIVGDIEVDSISGLTLNLVNSSIKGTINRNKTATKLSITLDNNSTINLTGNSYYTSLVNADSNNSNIIVGNYSWDKYNESAIPSNSSNSPSGPPNSPGNSSNPSPPGNSSNPRPPGNSSNPNSSDTTSPDTDNDDTDSDNVFDTYSSSKNLNICKSKFYSLVLILILFI